MDKYKKLASNTLILGIGQFSSKILSTLLIFLYTKTKWLDPVMLNQATNILNTGNLLMAIITLSICDGVVRFGLERENNGRQVFSIGITVTLAGIIVLLPFIPLVDSFMKTLQDGKGDGILIYIFIITSSIRSVCALFVRSRGHVKLYAVDGIITTFTLLIFGVALMGGLKLGSTGYIISIILSDFFSIIFLAFVAQLHKKFIIFGVDKHMRRDMLRYSIPLAPSAVTWWIATASNGYLLTYFVSKELAGVFNAASKLPNLIAVVSGIVSQAWQMSAVSEKNSRTIANFYSNVFNIYQSVVYVSAAGLLLFNKTLVGFFGSGFEMAYKYSPFLIMGVSFNCFSSFLNTVYTSDKKSGRSFVTMSVGAVANIGLNLLLIPLLGVNGATIATAMNFGIVFLIRAIDTRKIIFINLNIPKLVLNLSILLIMCFSIIFEGMYTPLVLAISFVLVSLFNLKTCMGMAKRLLTSKQR